MTGLGAIDLVVLAAYLLGITALGVWTRRWVRNISDFFMPRRFGKAMMITHAFGTGTAADQAVTVASGTFREGLSGIWYQWMWLFSTPFYWLIAPIMRRFRAVTTADVYALRYDRSVAVLFAVVGIANLSVKMGLMLKGAGALIDSCTGQLVNANLAIAITTILFVIYGSAGGLSAAIVTDFVQGFLIVVFSFLVLPFVLHAVGGLEGIRQTIQDPAMLSLVVPRKIGVFFVMMFSLQALVGIVAQPFIMGVCAAGRTEMDGRVGFMVGNVVKRICTVAWCLTAVAGVAWYTQQGVPLSTVNPDNVYGHMAWTFLPQAMPGLLGVFLASLLASVMGACSAYMVSSSGLFTKNIYRPAVPNRSERHYVWVARAASVLVVAGGVVFAYWVPNVVKALQIWLSIAPMMGIAFWFGLLWRRMTVAGAWAAAAVGFGAWFLATRLFFIGLVARLPIADSLRLVWQEADKAPEIYEPWRITFYMTAATLTAIVVSLLTKPVARERLDRFYALTRTPIRPGEKIAESCTLPEGATPATRPTLVPALGLEIPKPSGASIVGFLAGWMMVAALIGGFIWLVK
jgi:Na+/proline symporter